MTQINTSLGLLTNAREPDVQPMSALAQAHQAAKNMGFDVDVHVKFKNSDDTGIVIGFNTIRHEGLRTTGERAPLIIRHSDGAEREHSTGELEVLLQHCK